jgi:peptidyl-prolyl cis-trans isomerase C
MSSGEVRVRRPPAWLLRLLFCTACVAPSGCHRDTGVAGTLPPTASASATAVSSRAPVTLSPELSARVLARVGDRTITLGDYAAVLAGMDRLERARYQTPERRKQLLDELIDVELLAREAERKGLAERPETQELVRQILRDEVFAELRDKQPPLAQIPAADVRAYYDAHRADFKEPERRRISHIVVKDKALAERLIGEARGATPKAWGGLVKKNSLDKPAPDMPEELAGDLGLVTPPSFGKNDNARVPEPVRAAAFQIEEPGQVLGNPVEAAGGFHIVRLTAKNDARDRSLEEADRTIRVLIAQENLHRAEADLEKDLRSRIPVKIDEAALAKVSVPAPKAQP